MTGLYCDQAGSTSLKRGTTIARELAKEGYFTAMAGKWHLQGEPTDVGFQRYFGHLSGSTNFFVGNDSFRINGKPFTNFDEDFYTTVANTDHAIEFVDEALKRSRPFFLYLAHNAPHYPLHVLKEDYEKYQGKYDDGWDVIRQRRYAKQIEIGLLPADVAKLSDRPDTVKPWRDLSDEDKRWESNRMAAYAGMVDCMDREIGRLVDYLSDQNALDNTLLIFVSDNGACPFERTKGKEFQPYDSKSYWTYDQGWTHVGNTPFRFYKQNNHEGGIASPAIIHWPNGMKAEAGSIDRQPAHLIDLMATCLDLVGRNYPSQIDGRWVEPLMGRSLLPIIAGKQRKPHPYLYFQFSNNRALRVGDWKIASMRGAPWELFNLAEDRSETNNLVDKYPEQVAAMAEQWRGIAKEVDRLPEGQRRPISNKKQGEKPKKPKHKKTDE